MKYSIAVICMLFFSVNVCGQEQNLKARRRSLRPDTTMVQHQPAEEQTESPQRSDRKPSDSKEKPGLRRLNMEDAATQFQMANRFAKGDRFVAKNDSMAVDLWTKSARQGYALAMHKLGECYRYGYNGLPQDDKQAVYWWRKTLEQDRDTGAPMRKRELTALSTTVREVFLCTRFDLGNCYAFGFGVAEDDSMAIRLFREAAVTPEYQFRLGEKFYFGDGIHPSNSQALEWYTRSAEGGYRDAMYNVGNMYYEGRGTSKDPSKAVEWWKRASDAGDTMSAYNVACCYASGIGVAQNLKKANEWYEQSALLNNVKAQLALGYAYYHGTNGHKKSLRKARKWFELAARNGDAEAQYCMGILYYYGESVDANKREATRWFMKSARQGYEQSIGALQELGVKVRIEYE